MLFRRSRIKNMNSQEININDININGVSHTTFLGLITDQKLSWTYHDNHIQTRLSK